MGVLTERITTSDVVVMSNGGIKVLHKREILDDGEVIFERVEYFDGDKVDDAIWAEVEQRISQASQAANDKRRARPQP